jgi:non-ribosomal peptide synthetase component F
MSEWAPLYEGISVSLIDRFEAVVGKHGTRKAIVVEDGSSFTFSALNDLSADLAQHVVASLDRHGVTTSADERENDTPLVCVMLSRHVGLVASILAVFKSGGGYVPVDPTFPPERQSYVIKKAQCKLAIMDKETLEKAKETGVELPPEVILIDIKTVEVLNAKELPPAKQLQASMAERRADCYQRRQGGLAYVLFTSGSTGLPKGVSVRHQPVVHALVLSGGETREACTECLHFFQLQYVYNQTSNA